MPSCLSARAQARRRNASTVSTILVSDATALASVGLTPRQFRDFVREHRIPHVRAGRRMLARVDRVLEVIDRLSDATPRPFAGEWDEDAVVAAAAKGTT